MLISQVQSIAEGVVGRMTVVGEVERIEPVGTVQHTLTGAAIAAAVPLEEVIPPVCTVLQGPVARIVNLVEQVGSMTLVGNVSDEVSQDQHVVDSQETWVVPVVAFGEVVEAPIVHKIRWEPGMLGCNLGLQTDIGLLEVEVNVSTLGVILAALRGYHKA